MTDPAGKTALPDDHAEAAAERSRLSYSGHKLPLVVVFVWIAYLLFGLIYFLRQL